MAEGYCVWIPLLLAAVVIGMASCDLGTPCKVLCENGAEMKYCNRKTEIFKCCGPCEQPTCENPDPVQDCKESCTADCFCAEGYIRSHKGGPCVLKSSCEMK